MLKSTVSGDKLPQKVINIIEQYIVQITIKKKKNHNQHKIVNVFTHSRFSAVEVLLYIAFQRNSYRVFKLDCIWIELNWILQRHKKKMKAKSVRLISESQYLHH